MSKGVSPAFLAVVLWEEAVGGKDCTSHGCQNAPGGPDDHIHYAA